MGNPDQPMWPKEMPPWFPGSTTGKPGNGDGQQPMGTPNGVTPQPGGPPQNPERGDIQGNDWGSLWGQGVMGGLASPADLSPPFGSGYVAEGSGTQPGQRVPRGPGGRPGRPGKPQRGGRPNTRDPNQRVPPFPGAGGQAPFDGILIGGQPLRPEIVGNREFFPFLKDDNVTIQNVSNIPLKEGENLFLLPGGGQGSPPPMDSPNAPQRQWFGSSYNLQPYLKLIYNPTATRKVSFEYGLTTLLPFG